MRSIISQPADCITFSTHLYVQVNILVLHTSAIHGAMLCCSKCENLSIFLNAKTDLFMQNLCKNFVFYDQVHTR